eukprot:391960-Amphidinium_carterae.1
MVRTLLARIGAIGLLHKVEIVTDSGDCIGALLWQGRFPVLWFRICIDSACAKGASSTLSFRYVQLLSLSEAQSLDVLMLTFQMPIAWHHIELESAHKRANNVGSYT